MYLESMRQYYETYFKFDVIIIYLWKWLLKKATGTTTNCSKGKVSDIRHNTIIGYRKLSQWFIRNKEWIWTYLAERFLCHRRFSAYTYNKCMWCSGELWITVPQLYLIEKLSGQIYKLENENDTLAEKTSNLEKEHSYKNRKYWITGARSYRSWQHL